MTTSDDVSTPDLCTCGHEDHQHVRRNRRLECTVCTCADFDWDVDAKPHEHAASCYTTFSGKSYLQCGMVGRR